MWRLMRDTDFRAWETIGIVNGSRLSVFASPSKQLQIKSQLDRLRGLADLAVFINARVYEVDRAFYAKRIAPKLVKNTESGESTSGVSKC